jgi:hypothetical protein
MCEETVAEATCSGVHEFSTHVRSLLTCVLPLCPGNFESPTLH